MKTSENRKVELEKGCIGNKWVKLFFTPVEALDRGIWIIILRKKIFYGFNVEKILPLL